MESISQCCSGSVFVNKNTTTDSPFTIGDKGVMYKDQVLLFFCNGLFGRNIISYHDQIEIVKALNVAYQMGYTSGFDTPKYV